MSEQLVTIKGAREGLNFYFNTKSASFKEICEALEKLLLESGGFLHAATYYLYADKPFTSGEQEIIDEILIKYGLKKGKPLPERKVNRTFNANDENEHTFTAPRGGDSVLLTRSLRSGQKVTINGNGVLRGDVNTGAEVMASGNIIIMGAARGILHAGAGGDKSAFILVYELCCQQLRICDIVAVLPDNGKFSGPQIALVENDRIVIKPYEASTQKSAFAG